MAGLFVDGDPFDGEGLGDMGEVEVAIKRDSGPDSSGFDASMVRGIVGDEVRGLSVLEKQREVVKQPCRSRWFVLALRYFPLVGSRLFLGVAGLALMADHAHDMGLMTLGIEGVAQGLSVNGKSGVVLTEGLIPAL